MTKFTNHNSASIMQQTSSDLRVPLIKQEYNHYSPPPLTNHHHSPQQSQQHHNHHQYGSPNTNHQQPHTQQQQQQLHQQQQLQNFFSRFNPSACSPLANTENSIRSLTCSSYSPEHDPSHLTPSPIFTDYDENSSLSSEEHVLAPLVCSSANSSRPCLTWACKACKKKGVTVDRRKAATMRERRRLRKVGKCEFL